MKLSLTIAVTVVTLLGLGSTCGPKDMEKPVIAMVIPKDLDSLYPDNVPIIVVATDDIGVTRVDFKVNGSVVASDSVGVADTFAASWNAAAETLGGVFTIDAVAFDARDSSASAWARVIILSSITPKAEIAVDNDDGCFSVSRNLLPDSASGFIFGRGTNAAVGAYGTPDPQASRALYRFNISSWTGGNMRLNVMCREIKGGPPGRLDLYVVPDFDTIPTPGARMRLDLYWNLTANGSLSDTATPDTGWFAMTVPANLVQQYRSAGGYLGFLLLAHDDLTLTDRYYVLDTYDSSLPGTKKPYLTW